MLHHTTSGALVVVKHSFSTVKKDPHILIYPYLAVIFILLTSPIVGRFVISTWQRVQEPQLVEQVARAAPHQLLVHLGLVSFTVFYALFITSFFTCMISANILAELEQRPHSLFYGLEIVARRFLRVALFSLLAIFFFPMGLIAQRQKFTSSKGAFEAITSSFSLTMSQLAPAIVTGNKGVFATVRQAVDTLGQLWKESLFIRIALFAATLVIGFISLLPKLIEHYWFNSSSSHVVGWIIITLLVASGYVLIRVIGTVFTTTLYFEAKNKR